MKIKFESQGRGSSIIIVDGEVQGRLDNAGGWDGVYVTTNSGRFIARFKRLGGAVSVAKRWTKHNVAAQGGVEQLADAVEAHRAVDHGDDYRAFDRAFPTPRARATKKTRREAERTAIYAEGFIGHRCHFIGAEVYEQDLTAHGVLEEVLADGYRITLDDGSEKVIPLDGTSVWPPHDAKPNPIRIQQVA